ncbi:MAG: hypothetical protein WCQ99_05915 [Pseudomonadota bacterium]
MHKTTEQFWHRYFNLPKDLQESADDNFRLLKQNARHPSLQFKKVGKLWSARVGLAHRALAVEDGDDFIWVWIGSHDEYARMIKKRYK